MTIGNASIAYVDTKTTILTDGGNISVATSTTGADFTAFSAQACTQLTISNNTGTTIEFAVSGTGVAFPVFPATYYTFFGITDASSLSVRRTDQSDTSVTVIARWES